MVDLDRLPFEHVIVTGHDPAVVLLPTLQVHDTTPDAFAVLAPRPAAVADPDLYSTSIEHFARDAVLTVTVALAPAVMGEVNRVMPSFSVAFAAGVAVGSAVSAGVGSAGRVGELVATGEALGAGSGVAAGVVGAEVAGLHGGDVSRAGLRGARLATGDRAERDHADETGHNDRGLLPSGRLDPGRLQEGHRTPPSRPRHLRGIDGIRVFPQPAASASNARRSVGSTESPQRILTATQSTT